MTTMNPRLVRIDQLWRRLARLPDAAWKSRAYQELLRQIRAEVEAYRREEAARNRPDRQVAA